jgi:dCTP deaminase
MSVKPDKWIRKMSVEHKMIEPYEDRQVRDGVISYGVSSYGYDMRVADEFRIFTNVNSSVVDPKHFDAKSRQILSRWPARSNIFASRARC